MRRRASPGTRSRVPATSPHGRRRCSASRSLLELDESPLRIECFDISHVQGTQVVGSMVVFEDGLPRKGSTAGSSCADSTTRTAPRRPSTTPPPCTRSSPAGSGATSRSATSRRAATRRRGGRPASRTRPRLVVVDGNLPQVNAAARAIEDLGIVDVSVVGLAKRLEEVWVPGQDFPVVLPRTSEGLYLLQRLRDEAHRFAITFHRQRRSKAMTNSALDGIPGLGDVKRKALLKQFGSVKRIRAASAEEPRRGARHRSCTGGGHPTRVDWCTSGTDREPHDRRDRRRAQGEQ